MSYQDRHINASVLLLILVLYSSLALCYIRIVPLWEAPDEPAHFLYIQHMVDQGAPPPALPPQRGHFWEHGYITSAYEWHHPPLYYQLAALSLRASRWLHLAPPAQAFPEVKPGNWGTARLFAPTPFVWSEPYLIRLLALLTGLGTISTIYLAAWRLFPDDDVLPPLAAGTLAFVPQFTFLHAYITNDDLALLMSSLGLAALIFTATAAPGQQFRHWLASGLTISLALAVKLTTWFLVPLGFILLLLQRTQCPRLAQRFHVKVGLYLATLPLCLLISWSIWPDVVARLFHGSQSDAFKPEHLDPGYLLGLIPLTNASFWGTFGWMNLPLPNSIIWSLNLLLGIGLSAGALFIVRSWRKFTHSQRQSIWILVSAILLVIAQFILFNLAVHQPQGRFLHPAAVPIFVFYALGWSRLSGRWRRPAAVVLVSTLFLTNLYSLVFVVMPAYL